MTATFWSISNSMGDVKKSGSFGWCIKKNFLCLFPFKSCKDTMKLLNLCVMPRIGARSAVKLTL